MSKFFVRSPPPPLLYVSSLDYLVHAHIFHHLVDTTQIGSLYTLFLHAPLKAFTFVSDVTEMPADTWIRCRAQMNQVETVILAALHSATLGMCAGGGSGGSGTGEMWVHSGRRGEGG